jgi:hypothetical protein
MKLKMMIVLGALALGACNTTTADYRAGDVVQTADGRTKRLTAAEAKRMRCQDKQQKNAEVATAASVVGAGASIAGTAAAYHGGWGWGWGYHPGPAIAGAAVSGVSNVVAQQATNNQIEAAMGNC